MSILFYFLVFIKNSCNSEGKVIEHFGIQIALGEMLSVKMKIKMKIDVFYGRNGYFLESPNEDQINHWIN